MTTGAAKTDTTIPSHGVEPYKFGHTNVGKSIGKAVKNVANFAADSAAIQAKRGEELSAAEKVGKTARSNVRKAGKNIRGLETISNISAQQFPSTPLSKSPASKNAKARLARGMKPGAKAPKGKPVPAGDATPKFQEPTAVQAVAAGRKKAKQVRPQKKTSLSTNPL